MSDRMDEIRSTRAPRLRTDQIEILKRYGEIRKTEVGEVLFRAGDTENDFVVVLEGEVKVGDDFPGESQTIGTFHEGRFLGELNMLTGQAMYLTGVVSEAGEVLNISRERLKEVVTEEPNISDIILRAFLARRTYMMKTGLGLRIIGSRHSGDATRLREFAARNRVPHVWLELETDPKAGALLKRLGAEPSETPVTVWQGEDVQKNPTNLEFAHTTGLEVDAPLQRNYDLVVVGAGPAGLGASVYGASEGLSTLALESVALGGQAGTSSRIENYPGFPAGLSGFELASRVLVQADKFGARTAVPQEATGLRREDGRFRISLSGGGEVAARSVIAASGARYRRLEVASLGRFEGERPLRRHAGRGATLRGRGGRGRRRGQLGRTGRAIPGGAHQEGLPAHKGRRSGQEHVQLPGRQDHGQPPTSNCSPTPRSESSSERTAWRGSWSRTTARAHAEPWGREPSSSLSGPRPTPVGSEGVSSSTDAASS